MAFAMEAALRRAQLRPRRPSWTHLGGGRHWRGRRSPVRVSGRFAVVAAAAMGVGASPAATGLGLFARARMRPFGAPLRRQKGASDAPLAGPHPWRAGRRQGPGHCLHRTIATEFSPAHHQPVPRASDRYPQGRAPGVARLEPPRRTPSPPAAARPRARTIR